jgi:hypothetical protein
MTDHACGMTVDEEENRHIFHVSPYVYDSSGVTSNRSKVEIYSMTENVWVDGPDMPGRIAGTRAIQLEDTFQEFTISVFYVLRTFSVLSV